MAANTPKDRLSGILPPASFGVLILAGLYATSLYSYPLFHTLAELFSIVIAFSLFVLLWNGRGFFEDACLQLLGIAYFFVGAIDLVHTLAYKGINVFPGYGTNLPTQLWIAARYLESFSLLYALSLVGRKKIEHGRLIAVYAVITAAILVTIFAGVFPDCFIEGQGLTPFKVGSEYAICLILAGSLAILARKGKHFDPGVLLLVKWSIIATIGSELFFTFYVSVYGLSNLMGHFLKIVSFYLIYRAIISKGLMRPYEILFRDLVRHEREISRLNEDLGRAVSRLEESNKELEAFSYSVSHDLRAPLRGIDGFSRALAEDYGGRLDGEGREYLDRIIAGAGRMGRLIDDLLSLSRLSRAGIKRESVSLSGLAARIAEVIQSAEPGRAARFVIAPGLTAQGDEGLLNVVLENLIGNAWKFTAKREEAVVEFGSTVSEGGPVFFVRDNGAGFDQAYSNKLFTPFQRLHRAEEYAGTGIGLATVQRIIHRHGGRVWAEAEVGKGATFYFTL